MTCEVGWEKGGVASRKDNNSKNLLGRADWPWAKASVELRSLWTSPGENQGEGGAWSSS